MTQQFPAGQTVGLIPMSAKPAHAGHYKLIERAAAENDHVIVYVSLSDRKRRGELPISGETMGQIWRNYLEPIMPSNVEIVYGGSPIRNVFKQLGDEQGRFAAGDTDVATYNIYSDPEDMSANFPVRSMTKYYSDMWDAGLIDRIPVTRTSTVNVSGTAMRKMIAADDKESFMELLPDPLDDHARESIWRLLSA